MNPASKPPNGLISDGPNSAAELAGDQVGIEVASREKFRVPADLNQPPVIEHDDRVRVAHRREPMRDHERGAVAREALEGRAYGGLADGVQMRGGLVEDQHGRVLEERAGDRDALALAPRELRAPLTDDRVEPIGQGRQELVEGRALDGEAQ